MRELFKKKVAVEYLAKGMYVTELDRPWLESPFLLQGFVVKDDDDLNKIRDLCEYVFIDAERGIDIEPRHELQDNQKGRGQKATEKVVYIEQVSLEKEIAKASRIRQDTRRVLDDLYESARLGSTLDVEGAREVVNELVDSIIRNPDAQMLLTQLKNKDEYTAIHSMNVCVMALAFGRHMGLDKEDLQELGLGALMHDLGKMKIPDEILKKPSTLTPEEIEIMKLHPEAGKKLLEAAPEVLPKRVIEVAYTHHERIDGMGYPQGLKGEEIPLFGRMVTLVDVYDAVTSDRIYHDGESSSNAMRTLYEQRNERFDTGLVEQFIQCLGVFPLGSLVELNTGEVGIVVSLNREKHLRPKVLLLLDKNKKSYPRPKIIDLVKFSAKEKPEIRHVLEPLSFDIDVRPYLRDITWAV